MGPRAVSLLYITKIIITKSVVINVQSLINYNNRILAIIIIDCYKQIKVLCYNKIITCNKHFTTNFGNN